MADPWGEWPHRWFGAFCWEETHDEHFPAMSRMVDPSWRPGDLPALLRYLRDGPICWCSQSTFEPCRLCGEPQSEQATWLWDGEWLWPFNLGHDVERHGLRLPDALVERIRS